MPTGIVNIATEKRKKLLLVRHQCISLDERMRD